jgi:signal peptidase I
MRVTFGRIAGLGLAWSVAVALNRSLRRVHGASMEPTLHDGDVLLTTPLRHPARGHLVVIDEPADGSHQQVKRVLGLPGEVVRSVQGHLLVDGVGLLEPYAQGRGQNGALTVPPGHVVVLGDNRPASTDSRTYGPVPLARVRVRVVARLLPRPRLLTRDGPTRLSIADQATHDPSSAVS